MTVSNQILYESFDGICQSVIGTHAEPQPNPNQIPVEDITFSACVQFVGKWEGAVIVQCGYPVARLFTSKMFMQEPDTVTIEQVRDVMQEVANMLAGNIKPLLPDTCKLSLPTIVDGREVTFTIPNTRPINTAGYLLEGAPVNVILLEKSRAAA